MNKIKKNIFLLSVLSAFTLSSAGYRMHVPLESLNGGRLPNGSIIIGDATDINGPSKPTLTYFGMLKDTINLGETITVNWSSSNASYVTLSIHRSPSDSYTFSPNTAGNGAISINSFDENDVAGESKTLMYTVNSSQPIIYSVTPNSYWFSKVLLRNENSSVKLVGKNIGCIKWEVSYVNNKCYDAKTVAASDGYFSVNSYSEDSDGNQTIIVTPVTGNIGINGTGVAYIGFQPFSEDESISGDIKRFSYNVTNMPYITVFNGSTYKYYDQFNYSNYLDLSVSGGTQLNFKIMAGSQMIFEDSSKGLNFGTDKPVIIGPYAAGTTVTLNLKTTRYAYDKGTYIGNWTNENMGTADYILRVKFE